ncbi:MAG: hypothetical protein LLG00_16635 [Planctomycetaceae bacterium]|nr:hypothetical protein [Planctomycetaceae bacterium]
MTAILDADGDRMSIADLEVYGLPVREINLLEDRLGLVFVDELQEVDEGELRSSGGMGPKSVSVVRTAMERFLAGRPIKTPKECASFSRMESASLFQLAGV